MVIFYPRRRNLALQCIIKGEAETRRALLMDGKAGLGMNSTSQKWAFWVAVALGSLTLVAAYSNPVAGTFQAAILFAIAWGIYRGKAWAAIAGAYILLLPLVLFALEFWGGDLKTIASLAIGAVILCAAAFCFVRAAAQLWTVSGGLPRGWGWIVAMAIFGVARVCLQPYALGSTSMENTLLRGDSLLTDAVSLHFGRELRDGDLVAFHYPVDPREIFVKRIVGIPGDRLRLQDKRLYRNGKAVEEPFAIHITSYLDSYRDNFPSAPADTILPGASSEMLHNHVRNGEVWVPEGKYFVLGDNRDDSLDSRYWGFISRGEITGRPLLIYQSVSQDGPKRTIRWDRFFKIL
jgi:signal peptidase I